MYSPALVAFKDIEDARRAAETRELLDALVQMRPGAYHRFIDHLKQDQCDLADVCGTSATEEDSRGTLEENLVARHVWRQKAVAKLRAMRAPDVAPRALQYLLGEPLRCAAHPFAPSSTVVCRGHKQLFCALCVAPGGPHAGCDVASLRAAAARCNQAAHGNRGADGARAAQRPAQPHEEHHVDPAGGGAEEPAADMAYPATTLHRGEEFGWYPSLTNANGGHFAVVGGELPEGVRLDGVTGQLHGRVREVGSWRAEVRTGTLTREVRFEVAEGTMNTTFAGDGSTDKRITAEALASMHTMLARKVDVRIAAHKATGEGFGRMSEAEARMALARSAGSDGCAKYNGRELDGICGWINLALVNTNCDRPLQRVLPFVRTLNRFCVTAPEEGDDDAAPEKGKEMRWPGEEMKETWDDIGRGDWKLFRGGGPPTEHISWFAAQRGQAYRQPHYLATSLKQGTAERFARRKGAKPGRIPVIWEVLTHEERNCWHVNYLRFSFYDEAELLFPPGSFQRKQEILFSAYSVFTTRFPHFNSCSATPARVRREQCFLRRPSHPSRARGAASDSRILIELVDSESDTPALDTPAAAEHRGGGGDLERSARARYIADDLNPLEHLAGGRGGSVREGGGPRADDPVDKRGRAELAQNPQWPDSDGDRSSEVCDGGEADARAGVGDDLDCELQHSAEEQHPPEVQHEAEPPQEADEQRQEEQRQERQRAEEQHGAEVNNSGSPREPAGVPNADQAAPRALAPGDGRQVEMQGGLPPQAACPNPGGWGSAEAARKGARFGEQEACEGRAQPEPEQGGEQTEGRRKEPDAPEDQGESQRRAGGGRRGAAEQQARERAEQQLRLAGLAGASVPEVPRDASWQTALERNDSTDSLESLASLASPSQSPRGQPQKCGPDAAAAAAPPPAVAAGAEAEAAVAAAEAAVAAAEAAAAAVKAAVAAVQAAVAAAVAVTAGALDADWLWMWLPHKGGDRGGWSESAEWLRRVAKFRNLPQRDILEKRLAESDWDGCAIKVLIQDMAGGKGTLRQARERLDDLLCAAGGKTPERVKRLGNIVRMHQTRENMYLWQQQQQQPPQQQEDEQKHQQRQLQQHPQQQEQQHHQEGQQDGAEQASVKLMRNPCTGTLVPLKVPERLRNAKRGPAPGAAVQPLTTPLFGQTGRDLISCWGPHLLGHLRQTFLENGLRILCVENVIHPALSRAFERRWQEKGDPTPPTMVFHGTVPANIPSILEQGLRPGGQDGLQVHNGQAMGPGVYTARNPGLAAQYCGPSGLMLVCAGLTHGPHASCSRRLTIGYDTAVCFRDAGAVIPVLLATYQRPDPYYVCHHTPWPVPTYLDTRRTDLEGHTTPHVTPGLVLARDFRALVPIPVPPAAPIPDTDAVVISAPGGAAASAPRSAAYHPAAPGGMRQPEAPADAEEAHHRRRRRRGRGRHSSNLLA